MMELKLERGSWVLNENSGLPETVSGKEELLQRALRRLAIPRGSFPYDRELGSRLEELDPAEEHPEERALAFANEALMGMPGVRAVSAELLKNGQIRFALTTPLGEGNVTYGEL